MRLARLCHIALYIWLCQFFSTSQVQPGTPCSNGGKAAPLPDGAVVRFAAPKNSMIYHVAFSPDGQTLAMQTIHTILVGDIVSGKMRTLVQNRSNNVTFSPDGKYVVTDSVSSGLCFWDVATGAHIKSVQSNSRAILLTFTPDGKYLAWWRGAGNVSYADNQNPEKIADLPAGKAMDDFDFSPDGKMAALLIARNRMPYEVHLWNLAKHKLIARLSNKKKRLSTDGGLSFAPNTNFLVVGGSSVLDIWDWQKKKIVRRMSQPASKVAWLPDSNTMAVLTYSPSRGCKFETARLVEFVTGKEICQFHGHQTHVKHLAVSPANNGLIATSDGKEVLVWNTRMPPGFAIAKNVKLTADQMAKFWQTLDAPNPAKGYKAMLQLAEGGQNVIKFLQTRCKPAPVPDVAKIRRLIKELDSPVFARRSKASQLLKEMGRMAKVELQFALAQNQPLEMHLRLQALLKPLTKNPIQKGDVQNYRAVQVLFLIGSEESVKLLQRLAEGGTWSPQTKAALIAMKRLQQLRGNSTPTNSLSGKVSAIGNKLPPAAQPNSNTRHFVTGAGRRPSSVANVAK